LIFSRAGGRELDAGPAHIQKAIMGKVTVNFRCHSCGHCCTDVVCLPAPADVIRIVKRTKIHPKKFLEFLTPEEITGVESNDPTWLKCGDEKYMMALKRGKKGCYFLNKKTGFCRIYDDRPFLCRLYPFKLQETRKGKFKGFTLHKDVGCPRNRDGKADAAALYEIYLEDDRNQDDYHDLVKYFNRKNYRKTGPWDFLDLFIRIRAAKKKKKD
jgi:Fe-S-cluster containining protein